MLILSIDSAGAACGVCLWQDGTVLAQSVEQMQRGQDARLMPMVVDILASAGVSFSDLDKIAVTRGPGSFTGVRVGLAAARGIGLAGNKAVIGIDRFAIYRAAVAVAVAPDAQNAAGAEQSQQKNMSDTNILIVIDSKRAELFCKFYPTAGAAHEACLMTQAQIDTFMAEHPNTVIVGDIGTPDVDVAAICAMLASHAEVGATGAIPTPLYLRAPDVSFPKASKAR